ncbi:sugar-phosphatase [Sediminitomix flava]|uniref:Sugar-phosphatase n=2 Tax=Sediminitomix flava TaxID=379075 RepID=A0A315ZJS3_SEDFL|nr:sugar-phosphatase [Sediminitomix flava]
MDGLLIDSEPHWRTALVNVFRGLGIEMTRDMAKQTMGLRTADVVAYWYNIYKWEGPSVEEVCDRILEEVDRLVWAEGKIMPGVNELVKWVKANNLKLGLASSSPMSLIKSFVKKIGIENELEALRSGSEEAYGKPHPVVYIETAKELGLKPEECLAFEDSFTGLLAAKAARMKAVAVPEEADRKDPRFCIADVQLASLLDFNDEVFEKIIS